VSRPRFKPQAPPESRYVSLLGEFFTVKFVAFEVLTAVVMKISVGSEVLTAVVMKISVGSEVLTAVVMKISVGFEVLTAVVMKISVFWDITPCSHCNLLSCWFLSWLIFRPCRWRRYVPLKRLLTFEGLQGVICQKMELFMLIFQKSRSNNNSSNNNNNNNNRNVILKWNYSSSF
jgi:hypothetical protein